MSRGRPGVRQQFQAASPRRIPFGIQEHDQIQTPVKLARWVIVEIDVRIEFLAVEIFMRAAADVIGIVQ